ncbi:MAG TPA: NmrA/HSCARG family protein [bacterium]|jgi:uncharacterized protein YbjT (DUF2867 family)
MSDKKIILVTGTTGAQGGSVARHLLKDGTYAIRGITRDPDSDAAIKLASQGVKMVAGDLDNIDSLKAALDGCYGCFGVTNFWEHFDKEEQQGRNLVDAVKESNVEHFVFSSLPHVGKITNGELDVPHFDQKARIEEYAAGLGIPMTVVHVAFYYENFIYFFPPQKQEDGSYVFGFPQGETKFAMVSVEDVGGVVTSIFKNPGKYMGKTVGVVGDDRTCDVYANIMTEKLGKKVAYNHIDRDTFASFDFPGAADLAHMFDFNKRYLDNRTTDLEESKELYTGMSDFEYWIEHNREAFNLE